MTRTIYYTATSIDGFIADEDHSLEWLFAVPESDEQDADGFLTGIGALVMGASTYLWLLANSDVAARPELWHEWYGGRPVFVFAHRELPVLPADGLAFVQGDVAELYPQLAAAAGERAIWLIGGGGLAAQFAERGLLDELVLTVAPVLLGSGAPLFDGRMTSGLRLTEARPVGEFVRLTYVLDRS